MSSVLRAPSPPRAPLVGTFAAEAPKVLAFLRRDLLIALSYRTAFVAEIGGIVVQAITFYFVGRMVDPGVLPAYDGSRATYMQFVTVGIALGMFMVIGLGQVAASVRGEQLMGTLESVLLTPTASATIQIG
jgi:ABC-2 type transport system permease protein